jgi:hypothetical protein
VELVIGIALFSIFIGLLYPAIQISSNTYYMNITLNQLMNELDASIKRIELSAEENGEIDDWELADNNGKVAAIKIDGYWYGLNNNSLVRSKNKTLTDSKFLIEYDKTKKNQFEIHKFDFYLYDKNGNIIYEEKSENDTEPKYVRMEIELDNFSVESNKNKRLRLDFSSGFLM